MEIMSASAILGNLLPEQSRIWETTRQVGAGAGRDNGEVYRVTPLPQNHERNRDRSRERKGLRLTCLVILPLNPISPQVFFSPSFACLSVLLTMLSMMVEVSL